MNDEQGVIPTSNKKKNNPKSAIILDTHVIENYPQIIPTDCTLHLLGFNLQYSPSHEQYI